MSILENGPLDHIGIAVPEIESACTLFVSLLGAELEHREMVPGQQAEVAFLRMAGETTIELVAPTSDASPLARFLEKHGPGLHHLCMKVPDVAAALEAARAAGAKVVDDQARVGARNSRIAFLHPASLSGVLLELKESPASG